MNHPRDERKVTKARQTPSPRLVRQGWGPPKGGRGFGELLQTWRQAMSLLGSEPSKPEMARAAKPGTGEWEMQRSCRRRAAIVVCMWSFGPSAVEGSRNDGQGEVATPALPRPRKGPSPICGAQRSPLGWGSSALCLSGVGTQQEEQTVSVCVE
jgi:hypothetical protein